MADVKNNSDNNVKDDETKNTATTAEEDEKKARDKILRKRTAATQNPDESKTEAPKKTTNDGKIASSSKDGSNSNKNDNKEGTPSERPRRQRTRDRQRGNRRGTSNRAGEAPGRERGLPPFPGRYPAPPHNGGGYYNDHGPASRQYPPILHSRGGEAPGRERGLPPFPGRYPAPPHNGGGYYNDHGPASRQYPPTLHSRGGIPPGRWERGMNGPMGFPARGPPRPPHHPYHSRIPPSRRHRHVHRSRSPASRRHHNRRSYDSDSSRSRSRSVSRGSSYSSEGSRSSYYSKDDEDNASRSRSHSRSRSPSPRSSSRSDNGNLVDGLKSKTQKKKKQQQDVEIDEDNDSKKNEEENKDGENEGVERSSQTSKTSSSNKQRRVKRSRSRSEGRSEDGGRNRRGRSSRRGRQSRNQADSRSSHTDRSLSQSSASSSRSFSSSSSVSMYSNSSISEYSSDERGGEGRRRRQSSRERRRERKRRRRYRSRQGSRRDERSSGENSTFSKDQRTVFVSQLVMRTVERDLRRYFKKKIGCKVNDVILIRDRQNARNHKGCAYVEVGRIEDVAKAVAVSGIPPDWQKFPILVKASEAEKNYVLPSSETALMATTDSSEPTPAIAVTPNTIGAIRGTKNVASNVNQLNALKSSSLSYLSPLKDGNGKRIESQKVYIGNLDPAVSENHLFALFSQFGTLEKVTLQVDPNTRISRGYAFLAFRDPKVSHLAIRTMSGKIVAGRSLKTGWANQSSTRKDGCTIVTSDEFPENAAALSEKALSVLSQMTGGEGDGDGGSGSSSNAARDNGAEQEQPKNVVPGVVDGDKMIDSTVHTATAVELSKAMMATSTSNLSANESALATLAEQELDKALGLVPISGGSGTNGATSALAVPTVAEARASLAATVASQQLAAASVSRNAEIAVSSKMIGNFVKPTRHLLVHNMYDKDEETDDGWQKEIEEDFVEECSKFGKIESVTVMHTEPGGKIHASFVDPNGAKACAENLAGRWFDKRQLRVDYTEGGLPLVK